MVKVTKILSVFICATLLVGTTGCSVTNTNPVIRYGTEGSAIGLAIGMPVGGIVGLGYGIGNPQKDDEDHSINGEDIFGAFCFAGLVGGYAIGAIVGLVHWITDGPLPPVPEDAKPNSMDPPDYYK